MPSREVASTVHFRSAETNCHPLNGVIYCLEDDISVHQNYF
jgi:hypothetical protein